MLQIFKFNFHLIYTLLEIFQTKKSSFRTYIPIPHLESPTTPFNFETSMVMYFSFLIVLTGHLNSLSHLSSNIIPTVLTDLIFFQFHTYHPASTRLKIMTLNIETSLDESRDSISRFASKCSQ